MTDTAPAADLPLEHVHVAPDEEADGPAPAVVVLHGRGADEEDLLPVAAELPDELHVVSLRAPDPLQGGYTWYELDLSAGGLESSQPDPDDFRRSLDLIVESVDAAVDAYGLDPDRIGLLGFSQGAITSLSLLLRTRTATRGSSRSTVISPSRTPTTTPTGSEASRCSSGRETATA